MSKTNANNSTTLISGHHLATQMQGDFFI